MNKTEIWIWLSLIIKKSILNSILPNLMDFLAHTMRFGKTKIIRLRSYQAVRDVIEDLQNLDELIRFFNPEEYCSHIGYKACQE